MKREIIINEKNQHTIEALLAEVQKRSSSRNIAYLDILNTIGRIENAYGSYTKKSREGLEVHCDLWACRYPKAYKYTPQSTQFGLRYKGGSWRLAYLGRQDQSKTDDTELTVTYIPDLLIEEIIRKAKVIR